jgi:hypothetical protein
MEWGKCELSRGEGSSHSITLFTPSNDVSDLIIHISPMVMRSERAINTLNSKVSKLQVYLLNKTKAVHVVEETTLSPYGKHQMR